MPPRVLQAEQRGIGRLARPLVLSRCLAELFRGGGAIENVVRDLEGEAQSTAVARECRALRAAASTMDRADLSAGREQRAGLVPVNPAQPLGIRAGRLGLDRAG